MYTINTSKNINTYTIELNKTYNKDNINFIYLKIYN